MTTKKDTTRSFVGLNKFNTLAYIIIPLWGMALYFNILGHEFTQDDAIVIYENSATKQGVDGLPDIFSHDSFYGFFNEQGKSTLVSGGRYRPFSLAYFAVLYEFVGNNPMGFHVSSIVWYCLLSIMLFIFLSKLELSFTRSQQGVFALIVTLVFMSHPVHTEVVANIKGHDEIFSLFWGILAAILFLKYCHKQKILLLLGILGAQFLALLSKESAICFLVIIPAIVIFTHKNFNKRIVAQGFFALSAGVLIYLIVRYAVLGSPSVSAPTELMNNPFLKVVNGAYVPFSFEERIASIILGLGKYLQLLVFPHPLTNDYYPRIFPVGGLGQPTVLLSAIMHVCLILIAAIGLKNRSFITLVILFFYSSIFLVANILFPIGTHLSERFLFTPSLAICLLFGYGMTFWLRKETPYPKYALGILLLLFLAKTHTRNRVWKDDFTLLTTDVRVSSMSAKAQNAAGGALLTQAAKLEDVGQRELMYSEAIVHLKRAIAIHPTYKNAYLLLGNAYNYLKDYEKSIACYARAMELDPYYSEAEKNLQLTYREAGRIAGFEKNDIELAKGYLYKAFELNPGDYETVSLLGIAHGKEGNHEEAAVFFEKAIALRPDLARAYVNLGYAQLNLGREDEARINFQKALRIDPEAVNF